VIGVLRERRVIATAPELFASMAVVESRSGRNVAAKLGRN
jgi:hypothetical protein